MEKLLKFIFIALIAIFTSCDNKKQPSDCDETIDSITEAVKQSMYNPTFHSSDEFFEHVVLTKEFRRCQSILDTMSLSAANNIFNVVLRREGYVSYYNFLKEYDSSYNNVYRYLNNNSVQNVPDTVYDVYKKLDENVNSNNLNNEGKSDDAGDNVSRKRTARTSSINDSKIDQ